MTKFLLTQRLHRANLTLPRDVPKLANFQGAIQRVIVNGEVFERLMESGTEQQNVAVYRGPPCGHMPITHSATMARTFALQLSDREMSSPCQNGGVCQPLLASFICKCQPGFLGKRCEKRKTSKGTDNFSVLLLILFLCYRYRRSRSQSPG